MVISCWRKRGKSGESPALSRNCEATNPDFQVGRQSERPPCLFDEDRFLNSSIKQLRPALSVLLGGLTLALAGSPALAHHPFAMPEGGQMTWLQGLLSGIGHPLLGPDHLLFLVAIALVSWERPRRWLLPMLALGLIGSGVAQVVPLSESLTPWAEAAVSLTLVLEGLVILGRLPLITLLPAIALHGYLLGGTIVGAEPTPLLAYGLGLLVAQGALLLAATSLSRELQGWLGERNRQLLAAVWIGIGSAFAWSILIP